MALVLKKSLTPKHLTLLQCIRKRNYVSNNSKHIVSVSSGVACRNGLGFLDKSRRRLWVEDWKRAAAVHKEERKTSLRDCMSNTWAARYIAVAGLTRHLSTTGLQAGRLSSFVRPVQSCPNLLAPITPQAVYVRAYSASPCPPCPPCPSCCGALPPPCNQPPRCIQYMLGYYYYPYGYWFCGPYHVQGQCCPIGPSGACCPKCPAPACVCSATTVVPPTEKTDNKASDKAIVSPLYKGNLGTCNMAKMGARKAPLSAVRKTDPNDPKHPGMSKLFPFNIDAKKYSNPKSATVKKTNPTLHSSFLCVPYKTTSPLDIAASIENVGLNATSVNINNTKRSPHARIGFHMKNCSHTNSKLSPCRQKRCKYTGYISPLTIRTKDKDNLDKVEALSRMLGCKE